MRMIPEFEGDLALGTVPDDFVERIRRRVESGLLQPGSRTRADYRVRSSDRDSIVFGAEGFSTAYAIGLNEVRLSRVGRDQVHYQVSYWRWTRAAVAHSALIGLVLAALYASLPGVRRDVSLYPAGKVIFWSMVGFWGLVWPWLLAAWHRGFAERALRRVLSETLGGAGAVH